MLDEWKSRTLLGKRCGYNFCGEGICGSGFSGIEDAKFWWGVSASYRKSELRMHNFNEKHPHVIENVGCRCKICEGSILKSKKRQDVDAIYTCQAGWKASASSKKSKLQMHWSQKEHLQQRISRYCRYIRHQKSKSPHRSAYFNHGTPPSKKRLCNPANWSRACPTKLSRSA